MINKDRNYLENKVLHRSYILNVLLYKIYPQEVKVCEISVSNKNHSYVTVQQLHSNKHQYCILKKKKNGKKKKQPVTEAKAFKFAFWVYNRNPSPCIL